MTACEARKSWGRGRYLPMRRYEEFIVVRAIVRKLDVGLSHLNNYILLVRDRIKKNF